MDIITKTKMNVKIFLDVTSHEYAQTTAANKTVKSTAVPLTAMSPITVAIIFLNATAPTAILNIIIVGTNEY